MLYQNWDSSPQETVGNARGRTEKVLVYPYDIRIPKVRISTRQAQELRNHRWVGLLGGASLSCALTLITVNVYRVLISFGGQPSVMP